MPEPLVETVIEDARWNEIGIAVLAERAARTALDAVGLDAERCEISLLAADDARIRDLNAVYRGKDAPTNVLSWPSEDPGPPLPGERRFLGDLALAYETCMREAETAGLALRDHVAHLVVHGVLHLLGMDHEAEVAAAEMEGLETKILARMGIANPYDA
jgi:probable rRNA maturation factor